MTVPVIPSPDIWDEVEVETDLTRAFSAKRTRRFLKGPIPMTDIAAAAQLPGSALALFLAVHHRAALTRKEEVTLPAPLLKDLGIGKDAKARGIRHLESAGLVFTTREKGKSIRLRLRGNDHS